MMPNNSQPTMAPFREPSRERKASRWPQIVYALIVLALIVSLFMNYRLSKQVAFLKSGQTPAAADLQQTLSDIGKLMILPDGETPTVATVSDLSKLKDQPFFANAQIGDQVIIFSVSKKAILWRPSTKKIVEVAPINMNAQAQGQNNTQTAAAADQTANQPGSTANTATTKSESTTKTKKP